MIRKILSGAVLWTLLITGLHVHLNIGWSRLASSVKGRFESAPDDSMVVGFLPVT